MVFGKLPVSAGETVSPPPIVLWGEVRSRRKGVLVGGRHKGDTIALCHSLNYPCVLGNGFPILREQSDTACEGLTGVTNGLCHSMYASLRQLSPRGSCIIRERCTIGRPKTAFWLGSATGVYGPCSGVISDTCWLGGVTPAPCWLGSIISDICCLGGVISDTWEVIVAPWGPRHFLWVLLTLWTSRTFILLWYIYLFVQTTYIYFPVFLWCLWPLPLLPGTLGGSPSKKTAADLAQMEWRLAWGSEGPPYRPLSFAGRTTRNRKGAASSNVDSSCTRVDSSLFKYWEALWCLSVEISASDLVVQTLCCILCIESTHPCRF